MTADRWQQTSNSSRKNVTGKIHYSRGGWGLHLKVSKLSVQYPPRHQDFCTDPLYSENVTLHLKCLGYFF